MSNFKLSDEYDYLKTIKDFKADNNTLKPYSKIIQSKNTFGVYIKDKLIVGVSFKSLGTIIQKAEEFIEEQVLWIYYDQSEPDKEIEKLIKAPVKIIEKKEAKEDSYKIDIKSSIFSIIFFYCRPR